MAGMLKKLRTAYANLPDDQSKAANASPMYRNTPIKSKEQTMVDEMREHKERQAELARRGTMHSPTPEEEGYKKRGGRK